MHSTLGLCPTFSRFFSAGILASLFAGICCVPSPAAAEKPQRAAKRPNILWISTEDISPDLACYGDKYAITPNLDRLASQGAIFMRAFSHSGVCAPTRSGIITGMYPTSMGTHFMRCSGVPPTGVKCFPEYLRAAGYYCTNDSKTDYNFPAPLTAWDDSRRGAHWRNRADKDQPFFSVINLTLTHESQIRAPAKRFASQTASLTAEERHDPAKAELPPYYPDTPVVRRDWANYYDLITAMDKVVAKILKDLEDDGLADDTIVFFWGDHGRGLPRGKRWIYDSGMRVPLMVRWPGVIKPGTVREDLVCFLDLAPTVLSLAGVQRPDYMQGQVIIGPEQAPERDYIYAARDRMDETTDIIRGVRDKRFKYLRNYMPEVTYAQPIAYMDQMPTMQEWRRLAAAGKLNPVQSFFFSKTKPVEELYDVTVDPHEVNNLAADPKYRETLERMRAVHEAWRKDTKDLGLIPEAEFHEQRRPGGKWSVTADPTVKYAKGQAVLSCATEGSSIAYKIGDGKSWQLYAGHPVALQSGETLHAKACRLGYKDSQEVKLTAP